MTIFSLVKPENLSSFFEIVAAALRTDEAKCSTYAVDGDKASDPDSSSHGRSFIGNDRPWDYAAMTLPCIDFPTLKRLPGTSNSAEQPNALFVTVSTFLSDLSMFIPGGHHKVPYTHTCSSALP